MINLACPASPADFGPLALEILEVGSPGWPTCSTWPAPRAPVSSRPRPARSTAILWSTPSRRRYWGNVNPIGLRSVYDEAKRFGESLTMAYQRKHGLEVRIARIFNTYGPRMRPDDGRVVSNFVTQALQAGPSPSTATARRPAASAT